jgi:hypothetical protein
MTDRLTDQQLDVEIRAFLEWQAEDVHDAPAAREIARRVRTLAGTGFGGRRPTPRLVWVVVAGLLFASLAGVLISVGMRDPAIVESSPSPPGNGWIAYSTRGHHALDGVTGEIFVVREGSEPRRVAGGDARITTCPAFSPDGTKLLLLQGDDLVVLAGDPAAELREVGRFPVQGVGRIDRTCPAWAPSGAAVAVLLASGLVIVNLDGTRTTLPHPFDIGEEWAEPLFAWAPDGSTIAVAVVDGVHLVPVDGSPTRQVTYVRSGAVSWSPDGSRLALLDGGSGAIVRAIGANTPPVSLGSFGVPVWSPRGDSIALFEFGGLEIVNPDGSARRMAGAEAAYGFGGWSPDGAWLLRMFDTGVEAWSLHAVAAADGSDVTIVRGIEAGIGRNFPTLGDVSWQPVDRSMEIIP